eukprot:3029843-Prymnesium_polylepis.1
MLDRVPLVYRALTSSTVGRTKADELLFQVVMQLHHAAQQQTSSTWPALLASSVNLPAPGS